MTAPASPQPPTPAPLELPQDALDAFLAGGPLDPEETPADPPEPAEGTEEAPAEEPAKEPEAPKDPEPAKAEPQSRAALKLMRREAALRDRETALEAREATAIAALTKIREAEASAPGREALVRMAKTDPVAFFRAIGVDGGVAGRILLADHLGDKAPDAYKDLGRTHRERTEVLSEVDQLKAQLAQMQAATQAAAYQAQMASTATQYASGDLTAVPHVAKLVARKGAGTVAEQILAEIRSDAAVRIQTEGANARALTPAQAAKRLNDRIADLLGDATEPQVAKKPNAAKPSTGVPNDTTRSAPGRTAADDDKAAIERAIAEFAGR